MGWIGRGPTNWDAGDRDERSGPGHALERWAWCAGAERSRDARNRRALFRLRAVRHSRRAVVFWGRTAIPITTDTPVITCGRVGADLLIKATRSTGVMIRIQPERETRRFDGRTYWRRSTCGTGHGFYALTLCMDNHVPIVVLNLWEGDSLERLVRGEAVGTIIGG